MADIDAILKGWGFDYSNPEGGKTAAAHLGDAIAACADDATDVAARIQITSMIGLWMVKTAPATKTPPLLAALPTLIATVQQILLAPDDEPAPAEEGGEPREYDEAGLQSLAVALAKMLTQECVMNAPFAKAAWAPCTDALQALAEAGVSCKAADAWSDETGPPFSRKAAIDELLQVKPMYGQDSSPPPNVFDMAVAFVTMEGGCHATEAAALVSAIAMSNPAVLEGRMGGVFTCIANGASDLVAVVNGTAATAYPKDPAAFESATALACLLDDAVFPFMSSCAVLVQMATRNGACLAPHAEHFVALAESGTVLYGMDIMCVNIVAGIASAAPAGPAAVVPLLDRLYAVSIGMSNGDTVLAQALGNCGAASGDAAVAARCVALLARMLGEPTLSAQHGPGIVLGGIAKCLVTLGEGNTAALEPHMGAIRAQESANGMLVEKISDWFEGRSLKAVDDRLGALEAKFAALNEDFAKSCSNLEEVSALMDTKIAELKEFVGEIVQKLPQPCRLVVIGGAKKTLQLHFQCARTGETVTTETREWNGWCKVGFGLLKLGKCAVSAAVGNPISLGAGVSAIKDIYAGFSKGDAASPAFSAFITQPFLTSAERDNLIGQLKASSFFEKMAYDAQAGDWVLVGALSGAEADAEAAKKAAKAAKLADVTEVAGKNRGLGSIGSAAAFGQAMAGHAGVDSASSAAGAVVAADSANKKSKGGFGGFFKSKSSKGGKAAAAAPAAAPAAAAPAPSPPVPVAAGDTDRVAALERRVAQLEAQVQQLLAAAQ